MKKEVDGIIIGSDLFEMQNISTNKKLCNIIEGVLHKNQSSLIELVNYPCNGAGCYDLGFVLTQIIFKMGEKEFIKLVANLNHKEKKEILGLVSVGLEYGDNDYNNKMDDLKINKVFPILENVLNK